MARSFLSNLLNFIFVGGFVMALSSNAQASESKGKLIISVTELRSMTGKVAISIFPKENSEGFPDQGAKAIETFYVDIQEGQVVEVTSKPLPYGEYAVSLMHDQNGDGKFATFMGIPKDGFGFSKNPKIFFGPPKYETCAFTLNHDELKVPVRVKYLL